MSEKKSKSRKARARVDSPIFELVTEFYRLRKAVYQKGSPQSVADQYVKVLYKIFETRPDDVFQSRLKLCAIQDFMIDKAARGTGTAQDWQEYFEAVERLLPKFLDQPPDRPYMSRITEYVAELNRRAAQSAA